jgi:hypothetical protein
MDRLPPELLQPKKIVADMEIGESAYVPIVALTVDAEGGCWILRDAAIYFEDVPVRLYRLRCQIRREEDGYHITVPRMQYDIRSPNPAHGVRAVSITVLDEKD